MSLSAAVAAVAPVAVIRVILIAALALQAAPGAVADPQQPPAVPTAPADRTAAEGAPADPSAAPAPASGPVAGQRLSRLGGRAFLGRRDPIIGATVLVHPEGRPDKLYLTSTDAEGIFRVAGLPDGSYFVRIEREGLGAQTKNDVSLKFPFRAVVEFDLDPVSAASATSSRIIPEATAPSGPLVLRGGVFEVNGGPVPELRLRFIRADGEEDPRVVRSAADGSFELTGGGSGVWKLEVSGVGYLTQRMALDLTGEATLKVLVVRQPPDYDPTPFDLMPTEQPIPPVGFLEEAAGEVTPVLEPDASADASASAADAPGTD
jgi:hypothetical protein